MVAHTDATTPPHELLTFDVHAERIVDLHDAEALAALGVDLADAMAPWKPAVEAREEPSSWAVRGRLEEAGAHWLLDPADGVGDPARVRIKEVTCTQVTVAPTVDGAVGAVAKSIDPAASITLTLSAERLRPAG